MAPPMRSRIGLLFFLLVLSATPFAAAVAQNLSSRADLAGLYALRASLGLRSRDWPRRADPCTSWAGVGCRDGRVVSLNLSGLRRTRHGRLKPLFAVDGLRNLTELESFNSSRFVLLGSVPDWLATGLPLSFAVLDLSFTAVSGSIPASIGNLTSLQTIILSGNNLSGPVPAEFNNLKNLRVLNLSRNNLSGTVPDSLWSLPGVILFDFSDNVLTGSIPDTINSLSSNASRNYGNWFDISGNLFYGVLPAGFRTLLHRFHRVDVSANYFDGIFPVVGDSSNVSPQLNCFRNAPDQRIAANCEKFYARRSIQYDGPVELLSPPGSDRRPLPASLPEKKSRNELIYVLIGSIGGGLLLFMLVAAMILCCMHIGSPGDGETISASGVVTERMTEIVSSDQTRGKSSLPCAFSANLSSVGDSYAYEQLVQATMGFGDENLIRHGHSGNLYRGVLENGSMVVVRRIDAHVAKKDGYMVELELFAKGTHERLVPFLGHCLVREDEKFLVYRHVCNGDLSNVLHRQTMLGKDGMQSLDWIKRLKIATGIAEALCYLHLECTPPLVHRDLQATSILLDDKFEVRLGSLSEVCPQDGECHPNAITWLLRLSRLSAQGSSSSGPPASCTYDVYCFGKVLLELITGHLGISGSSGGGGTTNEWLERTLSHISAHDKERVVKIVDPSLTVDEDHLEEVWAMAIVAKCCLSPKPGKRPPMKYVLRALENPLKVVRDDDGGSSGSARLRATSSRGSWNAAFFGSWRRSSSDTVVPPRDDAASKRSEAVLTRGSHGDHSSSHRKQYKEIFPEPSSLPGDDDE